MSLEKTYKHFYQFLVNCVNTCLSVLKVIFRSKFNVQLPKTNEEICIVLGNGPSVNDYLKNQAAFIQKHPLLCVNAFSHTDEYTRLKPSYYVMLDPVLWSDVNEFGKKTIDAIVQKTSWKLQLLLPQQARKATLIRELEKQNANVQIHFYNYTFFEGSSSVAHWFYKHNLAMPQSQNVLVAALFICINIRFKEIYITGADHTWLEQMHVNNDNQLCLKDIHFYEKEQQVSYRPFYTDLTKTSTFKMHEILATFGKMFYGYWQIQKYAFTRGTAIYNASETSFIDAFPRKKEK